MVSILFRGNLHKELNLDERIIICYEQGMTARNIFERMEIDEKSLGMIVRDGLFMMPSDLIKDEDLLEIYPVYLGG